MNKQVLNKRGVYLSNLISMLVNFVTTLVGSLAMLIPVVSPTISASGALNVVVKLDQLVQVRPVDFMQLHQ